MKWLLDNVASGFVASGFHGQRPLYGRSPASAGDSLEADVRMRGLATAPVTLIEYSDFTCGYCLKFFKDTWPRIQARYVDTGKVRFLYKDYPRADQGPGIDAAMAARCAGAQGKYWAMHDRLFAAGGRLDKQVYLRHAIAISLDQPVFERCLHEGQYTKAIFEDRQEANQWGFHGTPGFILVRTAGEPSGKGTGRCDPRGISVRDVCRRNRETSGTAKK